jgi:hypothetical protein
MKLIYLAGLLLFTECAGAEKSVPIEITASSEPALPVGNMLQNSGFEKGLKPWQSNAKEGVQLSEEKKHEGNNSVCIVVKKKEKSKSLYCTRGHLEEPLEVGKSYILSGWVYATPEVSNCGCNYCGAGLAMSVYDKKWKKKDFCRIFTYGKNEWVHLVSNVLKIPDWYKNAEMSASISYAHGTAFFDNLKLSEAYVDLKFTISSKNILQALVEDETGRIVFDSGKLPDSTNSFSKKLRVLSPYRYFIKAVNKSGTFRTVSYPEKL